MSRRMQSPEGVTDFKDMLITGFAWSGDGKQLACTRGTLGSRCNPRYGFEVSLETNNGSAGTADNLRNYFSGRDGRQDATGGDDHGGTNKEAVGGVLRG